MIVVPNSSAPAWHGSVSESESGRSGNVGRAVSISAAQLGHPTNEEMRNDIPIPASICYWVTDYSIPFSQS